MFGRRNGWTRRVYIYIYIGELVSFFFTARMDGRKRLPSIILRLSYTRREEDTYINWEENFWYWLISIVKQKIYRFLCDTLFKDIFDISFCEKERGNIIFLNYQLRRLFSRFVRELVHPLPRPWGLLPFFRKSRRSFTLSAGRKIGLDNLDPYISSSSLDLEATHFATRETVTQFGLVVTWKPHCVVWISDFISWN